MNRFFSPLLIMMSVVVMVAALADRSASAGPDSHAQQPAADDVTVCHPIPSRHGDGVDVVVYHVSPDETETLAEHREHGDLLLNESSETKRRDCPGNVIHIDRP